MIEMELWEVYGSKSEYLKAPKREALKIRLILQARHKLENEQAAAERKRLAEQAAAWEAMTQGPQ